MSERTVSQTINLMWDLLTKFVLEHPGCPELVLLEAFRSLNPEVKEERLHEFLAGWLMTGTVNKRGGKYYPANARGEA